MLRQLSYAAAVLPEDLLERLDWAKANDEASATMALEASRFAKTHLTLEASAVA